MLFFICPFKMQMWPDVAVRCKDSTETGETEKETENHGAMRTEPNQGFLTPYIHSHVPELVSPKNYNKASFQKEVFFFFYFWKIRQRANFPDTWASLFAPHVAPVPPLDSLTT